jgi:acyl-CoA reductase-like NAD-dependent aldehyde dehydrogenase
MTKTDGHEAAAGSTRETITVPALIGGIWRNGDRHVEVHDPYRGNVVGHVPVSTKRDLDDALDAAVLGSATMAKMPGYERAALLRRAADAVEARAEDIGQVMSVETGKALMDCVVEVARSADTLRLSAEEAVRIQGEHIPMDASAIGAGKLALVTRFPVGVIAAVTPFNGPVSLAAHKVGPALAAGNALVLKPSPKAPLSAHLFALAVNEAGLPPGALNTLFGDTISPGLVGDPRVDFVSFTGSIPVGKAIRTSIGMKRAALELGGVGPTFVHHDADLDKAALACARNSMLLAGQSCISVQNVFVEQRVQEQFVELLTKYVRAVRFGDPLDSETEVGTLIDEEAAKRVEAMVERAVSSGATAICDGERRGAQMDAVVLTNVRPDMDVVAQEVFGPVMTVQPYTDIDGVIRSINSSPFGLQCGIFTDSLDLAMSVYRTLQTGGVIVNATSRWRSDQMPYGGVKDSGVGREGPKFAIREMTDERLLVIN